MLVLFPVVEGIGMARTKRSTAGDREQFWREQLRQQQASGQGACVIYLGGCSGGGAVGLCPEAIPEFGAADVQRAQGPHRGGPVLHPPHARPFQPRADDLTARLGGSGADVPPALAIGRVVRPVAIVLEIPDQLAERLPDL